MGSNMKRVLSILLIIFSIQLFSQSNPTEFPKIGFADMYWLKKNPFYGNSSSINYDDSSYFYPQLLELGLTHVMTNGDAIPLNPAYNSSIKILDYNFAKPSNQSYHRPYEYGLATGNALDHYAYEAGGNIAILTNPNPPDNCGFGSATKSSWWIYPYNSECIGNKNKTDLDGSQTITVHYAEVGLDEPGILLKAKPDASHLPRNNQWGFDFLYRLRIRAKIDGASGNVNVARVRIWEQMPGSASPMIRNNSGIYSNIENQSKGMSALTLTDYTYYITANNFNGTNYTDLVSPNTFRKTIELNNLGGTSDLYITIEWLGTRNLYIDKIAIYNTFYDDLFIANETIQQNTRNNIKSDLNSLFGSIKTNPLFNQLYNDEPYPIYYRGLGEVSNLSEDELGAGKFVNGATGALSNDMGMLANSQRRLPYILYDYYPITENTSTSSSGSNSIQNAYDKLIYTDGGSPGYGVQRYIGLKSGIQMAQNFTPDPTDDVPFYHTIQVQAEKNVASGVWVTSLPRYRAPTNSEILAQGNLAICYGAKGIMYFLICTDTPSPTNSNTVVAYYGLFEQKDHFGEVIQNPAATQCRNNRFWAVKQLNQHISSMESELLQLTWTNGYTIHLNQGYPNYITNLKSYTTGGTQDSYPSSTYVELGTFKKSDQINNNNLEYFFVVNRRTLTTEQRNITITFNKSSIYNNWKITEVGTSNSWTVAKNGTFTTTYQPGEGKLFRFEPVILAGGFIKYNETISGTNTIPQEIYVDPNAILTINGTCNIYKYVFINPGGKIIVSPGAQLKFYDIGTIIAYGVLTANGLSNNRIVFDKGSSTWGPLFLQGTGTSGFNHKIFKYPQWKRCSGFKRSQF